MRVRVGYEKDLIIPCTTIIILYEGLHLNDMFFNFFYHIDRDFIAYRVNQIRNLYYIRIYSFSHNVFSPLYYKAWYEKESLKQFLLRVFLTLACDRYWLL